MAVKFKKGIDLGNQRAIAAADPSVATDLATKQYVDNVANNRDWKESVRVATTANITLSGTQTINGVAVVAGERVLVKNQTAGADNGIYVVAAGAWTRAADADTSTDVHAGMTVTAAEGTVDGDKRYVLTTNDPITLGTTALVFTVDASGGTTYIAGSGLTESPAGTFNVGVGNGMAATADAVNVDPAVVVRKYAADCAATTNPQTFTHALGTNDLTVAVWDVAANELVFPDITKGSGTVIVDWGAAPTAAQYRVIIHG